jgi:Glyoxalase/Bleomycin resistance protein/Dioxygenase superfamily
VTNDVDGTYSALRAKGVAFEETTNSTYKICNCFFRDPDGYLLEIQKFLSPDWPRQRADAAVGPASNRQPGETMP